MLDAYNIKTKKESQSLLLKNLRLFKTIKLYNNKVYKLDLKRYKDFNSLLRGVTLTIRYLKV